MSQGSCRNHLSVQSLKVPHDARRREQVNQGSQSGKKNKTKKKVSQEFQLIISTLTARTSDCQQASLLQVNKHFIHCLNLPPTTPLSIYII